VGEIVTFREQILSRPPVVQEMLKILIVRLGVEPGNESLSHEDLTPKAVSWWESIYAEANGVIPVTETDLAEELISRVRRQEVWGKILRGNSN